MISGHLLLSGAVSVLRILAKAGDWILDHTIGRAVDHLPQQASPHATFPHSSTRRPATTSPEQHLATPILPPGERPVYPRMVPKVIKVEGLLPVEAPRRLHPGSADALTLSGRKIQ
jgi:hypothetical protein